MCANPCFFVQNNYIDRATAPVAMYARTRGYRVEDRSLTPQFDADVCGIDWTLRGHVIAFGSVGFLRSLRESKSLRNFILHDDTVFSASTWSQELGIAMLNEKGQVVPAQSVAGIIGEDAMHVRPLTHDKAFNAAKFDRRQWIEVFAERETSGDLYCFVSPAKEIQAEWRCWIVGRDLVECSQYRSSGQMHIERGAPSDVRAFVESIASVWLPFDSVVIDVARTPNGLRVIEFNPIQSSGWYAADVPTVLDAWVSLVDHSIQ